MPRGFLLPALACTVFLAAPVLKSQPAPEDRTREVAIASSKDGAPQPALMYIPPGAAASEQGPRVPLLVFLHSWSTTYKTVGGLEDTVAEAKRRGWILIDPDFRGVNDHPDACASDLAVQDVLDSVAFAQKEARVDERRIYLLGGSGGGHMGLMMAARAPKLWTAVSVWVPISNLATWYQFSKSTNSQYYRMMDQVFGGPPDTPERDREYRHRSPLFILSEAKGVRLFIDTGVNDGHGRNSVPLRQSLEAFNVLAKANGQPDKTLAEGDIELMTREARIPAYLAREKDDDPARKQKILFRRAAGSATLTIYDGGHSVDVATGVRYFEP